MASVFLSFDRRSDTAHAAYRDARPRMLIKSRRGGVQYGQHQLWLSGRA